MSALPSKGEVWRRKRAYEKAVTVRIDSVDADGSHVEFVKLTDAKGRPVRMELTRVKRKSFMSDYCPKDAA